MESENLIIEYDVYVLQISTRFSLYYLVHIFCISINIFYNIHNIFSVHNYIAYQWMLIQFIHIYLYLSAVCCFGGL